MSLNPEVVDLLPLPIQVPPKGDDPSDLIYRKAPVVSYWILPEPVPDSPVGPDIDVHSLDPGHLRVDGGLVGGEVTEDFIRRRVCPDPIFVINYFSIPESDLFLF